MIIPWAMAAMFLMTDMEYQYSGCCGCGQFSVLSSQYFSHHEDGYQGWGDFRGRGNLLLMVETLVLRCVAPAPSRVSAYGLPWFALFSFYFLCYFLRDFRVFPRRRCLEQRLRSGD